MGRFTFTLDEEIKMTDIAYNFLKQNIPFVVMPSLNNDDFESLVLSFQERNDLINKLKMTDRLTPDENKKMMDNIYSFSASNIPFFVLPSLNKDDFKSLKLALIKRIKLLNNGGLTRQKHGEIIELERVKSYPVIKYDLEQIEA